MLRMISFTFLLVLSACASDPVSLNQNAEADYLRGQMYMDKGNYSQAVLFMQKYSVRYPYSKYATAAEVMLIKAAYFDGQYVLSETLGLRFMDAHPNHEERVYAQYVVAMSYYKQSSSSSLDQKFSHKARTALIELNKQFPDSAYKAEVSKYLQILNNRIAEHEYLVGKFYLDKELFVAAINRFLIVRNQYLNAESAPEALYQLAFAYLKLGQKERSDEAIKALTEQFPQSSWASKAKQLS